MMPPMMATTLVWLTIRTTCSSVKRRERMVQGNEHAIREIVVYDEDCEENADAEAESEALEEIAHEDNGAMPIADETVAE